MRSLWNAIPEWVHKLYSLCAEEGNFPDGWKQANLVVLPKGSDRDKSDPGSYRPICLLPTPGKVLERLMVDNLQVALEDCPRSGSQYGFVRGRSTEDALRIVSDSPSTHVLGIFVDFKRAFDHLLWSGVLGRLRELDGVDVRLWEDYFSCRSVVAQQGDRFLFQGVMKGCPQGSICGPFIWNMMMDDLLRELEEMGVRFVADANDLLLFVEGESSAALSCEGTRFLEVVSRWGIRVGVEISIGKTHCMILKACVRAAHHARPRLGTARLRYVTSTKYLGIYIGEGLNFNCHLQMITPKLNGAIQPLRRVLRKEWGLSDRTAMVWFLGLFQAIVLYACRAWVGAARSATGRKKLLALQRTALLACAKVFRTVSVSAHGLSSMGLGD